MTEQQFLEVCKSQFGSISALDTVTDFYEREKKFAAIMQDLSRAVLQNSISDVSTADRRKKKRFARLEK